MTDFGDKIWEVDFMQCPQRFCNYLRQQMFDIDGLIEDGVAVNIKTVDP